MTATNLEKHEIERTQFVSKAPIMVTHDGVLQDPLGYRVAYVLGFGLAGAILANTTLFLYFFSFHSSG
jgi:hypothetical protein